MFILSVHSWGQYNSSSILSGCVSNSTISGISLSSVGLQQTAKVLYSDGPPIWYENSASVSVFRHDKLLSLTKISHLQLRSEASGTHIDVHNRSTQSLLGNPFSPIFQTLTPNLNPLNSDLSTKTPLAQTIVQSNLFPLRRSGT